ncbi:putative Selectively expressed in embryonic epithelia protein-1 [Paragonimus heterotremus]|uniref:Putative Selectively expressed in embryonic epithelia protein-1 n=1 Tax=Paragonimus heterotremus TaxID=100268 RepID=A0A8J4TN30_9TREM|nr:putative Selectively expressed in embryonic epithelia protein-1 [Paragonimus heterotremus]
MRICQHLDGLCRWRHKKWLILLAALFELLWFGGYHYGYNALIYPYKQLGVFAQMCNVTNQGCELQERMFHYAFIIWVVTQMCLITVTGILMDRVGLRVLKITASFMYFLGTLMFAFVNAETGGMLFVAGILVALSTTSTLICNHQISSMFPKYRGLAISLMSGAFDSSTIVTFIISRIAEKIPLQISFLFVACCGLVFGILMALFGLTQWAPDMSKKMVTSCSKAEVEFAKGIIIIENNEDNTDANLNVEDHIQRILQYRYTSLCRCICSWPFFLVTLWFMFGLLRFSYFLNQMGQQLTFMFGDDADTINELRSVSSALLMCGLVISPISGAVLDVSRAVVNRKLQSKLQETKKETSCLDELYWIHLRAIAPAFLLMAVAAITFSLLNFVKTKPAFFAGFIFFVILRSLLFSASVNFVLIAFPQRYFGTLNGLVNTVGGIFSLLQYGMLELSPVAGNSLAVGIAVVLFVSPVLIFVKRR